MSILSDIPPLNNHSFLGDLQPEKTFLEFEGPIFFESTDARGARLLAYQCAERDRVGIYFVATASNDLIERLEKGKITIADSLDQTPSWLVEIDLYEWSMTKVIDCPYRLLPNDYRPKANTYLTTPDGDGSESRPPHSFPTMPAVESTSRNGPAVKT